MSIQYISTNKNYKRLYNAPIDPSLVWDDITELRNYLNDPTCYLNMIVGCNGKAYIVVEKNGIKDIEPIGNINSGGTINGSLYIGSEQPTDDEIMVWIDTSDNEYTGDISDLVIEEFRSIIQSMSEEIANLKNRVSTLESGIIIPSYDGYTVLNEDSDILVNEDGNTLIL